MKKFNNVIFFSFILIQSCSKGEISTTPAPTPTPTPPQITLTLPKVSLPSNSTITEISQFQAKLAYIVSDFGGTKITENGICWSTNSNPTINDKKTIDTTPTSASQAIVGVMTNLLPKTKYFVRAYATNSVGTSYGSELNFITDTLYGCFTNPTVFKSDVFAQQTNDGKILVSSFNATANELNNKLVNGLIKLNSDGTLDNSFVYNQNLNGIGVLRGKYKILVQSDGKYIACYNDNGITKFIRINTNGTIDNTYQTSISATALYDMEIQNDDKILLGGTINGGKIVRLNTNGSLDTTFGVKGVTISGWINAISINNDGKIILSSVGNGLLRLNADGSFDNSFKTTSNIAVYHIVKTLSNKFLIQYSDNSTSNNSYIIRINSDGSKDESFKSITLNDLNVNYLSNIQSDNYIYISGQFSKINNESINGLARFNLDGTIDKTLNVGFGFTYTGTLSGNNLRLYTGFLSSDKKIIVSGGFDKYDGKKIKYFSKINYDGTICQ